MANILQVLSLFSDNEAFGTDNNNCNYFGAMNEHDIEKYRKSKYGSDYFIFLFEDISKVNRLIDDMYIFCNVIKFGLLDCKKYSVCVNLKIVKKIMNDEDYYCFVHKKPGLVFFINGYTRPTFFDIFSHDECNKF